MWLLENYLFHSLLLFLSRQYKLSNFECILTCVIMINSIFVDLPSNSITSFCSPMYIRAYIYMYLLYNIYLQFPGNFSTSDVKGDQPGQTNSPFPHKPHI